MKYFILMISDEKLQGDGSSSCHVLMVLSQLHKKLNQSNISNTTQECWMIITLDQHAA